jgi:hypothetical protein
VGWTSVDTKYHSMGWVFEVTERMVSPNKSTNYLGYDVFASATTIAASPTKPPPQPGPPPRRPCHPYIAIAVESSDGEIEEGADEITSPDMLAELLKAHDALGDGGGLSALIKRCRARL